MKKVFRTAITVIALVPLVSKAQWTTTTSPDTHFTYTGYVGIGTTTPAEKLNVIGNVRADGTYPYLDLYNSSWGAHTYIQNGVDWVGSGAGNYLSFLNPAGKGFAFSAASTNLLLINSNGYVGIGTTSPGYKLDVNGQGQLVQNLFIKSNGVNSSEIILYKQNGTYYDIVGNNSGFQIYNGESNHAVINTDANDNVGIGTNDTKGYKFAVNGNFIATAVTVKLYANWPDYVFKPTYKLPSLTAVKTYIGKNRHLPEMPSAQEVAKNGVNLGEIVKIQTKKIEELTLYLIDKDKELKELKQQMLLIQIQQSELKQQKQLSQAQQNQIDELRKQVETLLKNKP